MEKRFSIASAVIGSQRSFPGISAQFEEKLFTSLQFHYDTENFFTVKYFEPWEIFTGALIYKFDGFTFINNLFLWSVVDYCRAV